MATTEVKGGREGGERSTYVLFGVVGAVVLVFS